MALWVYLEGAFFRPPLTKLIMAMLDNQANNTANGTQESLFLGIGSLDNWWVLIMKILLALAVVAWLIIIAKIVSQLISNHLQRKSIADQDTTIKVSTLLNDTVFYGIVLIAILIGCMIVGIDISIIMRGLSFAIWFAFMDIFGNMIAGLFILTNKEYKLHNIIEIEQDDEIYFWRVEDINIRYTVIRLLDHRRVIVPNLRMITHPVMTFDSENIVRLDFEMRIDPKSPLPESLLLIKDAINSVTFVKKHEDTLVNIQNMDNGELTLLIYFYYDPQTGMLRKKAKGQVQEAILKVCKEHNIKIPYPHKVITTDKNDKNLLDTALITSEMMYSFSHGNEKK